MSIPFSIILKVHFISLVAYLVLFGIKVYFLYRGREVQLGRFRKSTRWLEILLGIAILSSGIGLIFNSGYARQTWMIVKLILFAAFMGLAIIGFKRYSKWMVTVAGLIFLYIFGISESKSLSMAAEKASVDEEIADTTSNAYNPILHGKAIYKDIGCAACHGANGDQQLSGAQLLSQSKLTVTEAAQVITNGRNNMPAYEGRLQKFEVMAVSQYISTLKEGSDE